MIAEQWKHFCWSLLQLYLLSSVVLDDLNNKMNNKLELHKLNNKELNMMDTHTHLDIYNMSITANIEIVQTLNLSIKIK